MQLNFASRGWAFRRHSRHMRGHSAWSSIVLVALREFQLYLWERIPLHGTSRIERLNPEPLLRTPAPHQGVRLTRRSTENHSWRRKPGCTPRSLCLLVESEGKRQDTSLCDQTARELPRPLSARPHRSERVGEVCWVGLSILTTTLQRYLRPCQCLGSWWRRENEEGALVGLWPCMDSYSLDSN